MASHGVQVVIDCADPARLSAFWAEALGYVVQPPPEGFGSWAEALDAWQVPVEQRDAYSAIVDPGGRGPRILFQKVPEPRSGRNRQHLDVELDTRGAADPWSAALDHVARLETLGARRVAEYSELGMHWMTCEDPEGNLFDVCVPVRP